MAVPAMGRDLICYRGSSGALHVMDGRCPHMGVRLATDGIVQGDWIRCRFHGWCWDADGNNCHVPYRERPLAMVRLRTYRVDETDGVALISIPPSDEA